MQNDTAVFNWHGIEMDISTNNTFTNNNASANNFSGLDLEGSSNNTVTNNIASGQSAGIGIDLGIPYELSDYNDTVVNNTGIEQL